MSNDNEERYLSTIKSIQDSYISKSFPEVVPDNLEILSTIRYDPSLTKNAPASSDQIRKSNFFLFEEHVQRTQFTLQYFQLQFYGNTDLAFEFTADNFFNYLVSAFSQSGKSLAEPYKVRCLFHLNSDLVVELHPTPVRENLLDGILTPSLPETDDLPEFAENKTWDVYIDSKPTLISPFTSFKTTTRSHYSDSRARALPGLRPEAEEVILFNPQNNLMEGSITNVAVKRKSDGKWITPQLSSGCLCGVMRHFLLRKNYLEEETISMDQIEIGSEVLLFNAIMGVVKGRIVGRAS
ncbi:aminotransferase-like protein [Scheffersomyces stipitis CBS 6054]|uniref:Aminotransferase-like protein n=1 Tax=Scheffersomyces stipitis (strain ATCC 58785 / CBS 6054 / NBRC 10063 / NRRL Y-11545) TaxID=322104 RepID=A3LND6_PICST|nr:aminotransferase-like protein [Scheffersomyces stipitis CBS 6054]ABN64314.1 aminotransferase-like protein [Scheffersomyces stipitis CBS 6054]KAG2736657.1 hypothetical protein G9P44_000747 [Scheffersomyces stipitis]